VLQTALNDFYVSYEINAYTRQANRMIQIYSTLHANIQDAFNRGGVEIMSPHYSSLRDGNTTTIPADHLPADYRAPAFRVDGPGTRSRQDE
jgi:small-conductance mechanosensitive channel